MKMSGFADHWNVDFAQERESLHFLGKMGTKTPENWDKIICNFYGAGLWSHL